MSSIKISIIIATLNSGNNLKKTFASVLDQKYKEKEIIVIDGGSADSTRQIIDSHKKHLAHYESKKDRGISHAFNKGVKKATGDYLFFLGAGDFFWGENALSKMMKGVNPQRDLLVCGKIARVDSTNKVIYTAPNSFNRLSLLYKMGLPHQGLFMSRKYFEKYGLFDEQLKYAMDYEMLLRSFHHFPKVIFKNIVVAAWRTGGVGTDKTDKVLDEYRQIRLRHKIAPRFILCAIDLLSRIKFKLTQ